MWNVWPQILNASHKCLRIFKTNYTLHLQIFCSPVLYLSYFLLHSSSDPAGYTSGNGLHCSRQLLWDIAVTPAPVITVGAFLNQTNCSVWLSNQKKEEERTEHEFSCEKTWQMLTEAEVDKLCTQWRIHSVTCLLQDTFWSPFTGENSNHNLKYNSVWLLFICIVWLKKLLFRLIFML